MIRILVKEIVLYTGNSPLEAPLIWWDTETVPYQLILLWSLLDSNICLYESTFLSTIEFEKNIGR